ncbi:MAG: DUF983 domain-containing protein [Rhizobiales bacterium]|nr:DUF983 domain-containing protein [Hyphomicrobiales bacterium]NRB14876.1 DUF983 domain-containing protein [Hyphomicrobiales bacterium]
MSQIDNEKITAESLQVAKERNVWQAIRRGLSCKCPRCNIGKTYRKYLKVADECNHCGQEFHHHRADDFPPYIVITIVGHIVLSAATSLQIIYGPPMWVHMALWLPLILILSLSMLPPVKAALVGLQWAHYMHGFDTDDHSPKWDEPNL